MYLQEVEIDKTFPSSELSSINCNIENEKSDKKGRVYVHDNLNCLIRPQDYSVLQGGE